MDGVLQSSGSISVIEVPTDADEKFVTFLREAIVNAKSLSDAQLQVSVVKQRYNHGSQQLQLHVSCADAELFKIADYTDMKKKCKDGSLQVFCVDKLRYFENCENPSMFFTKAEKHWLVLHELESIKVADELLGLPGHPKLKLKKGTSLLNGSIHHGLITQVFPLHESEELPALESKWFRRRLPLFHKTPISSIRSYFGDMIAIYFAFLEFYTSALIIPALVGIIYYVFQFHKSDFEALIILAIINLIWSTAFLESWKRRSNSLAYIWGTNDMKLVEEARPNFHGETGKNPVTGKDEPVYPKWKKNIWFYCLSLPVVILCLSVSLMAMVVYIECENWMLTWYNSQQDKGWYEEAASYVPTVVYSLAIIIMNQMYKPLAIWLSEKENHRLQTSFDNHLIVKLVLFWFINTFIYMFYTAFVQQDLAALRKAVLTELIVTQAVDQLQETLLPYLMYKLRKRDLGNIDVGSSHASATVTAALKQSRKDVYEGTFDDYLELFIQFGYITLFSCVTPLAAILSLVNNVIEQWSDAIKLCWIYQRPFPRPVSDIGAWQLVFELMGYLAIVTNSALIGLCVYQRNLLPDITDMQMVMIAVALEHVFIVVRVLVARLIPDQAKWVEIALARDAYRLKTKALAQRDDDWDEQVDKKTN